MTIPAPPAKYRIESIDMLRGLVMIIMALDHTRDFFHYAAYTGDPLDLDTTTPILYFTRWITHLCAPTFVFLSGVSIYLQSQRKTKKELSIFLIKRGFWLMFFEVFIIALITGFNLTYPVIPLVVVWAIGISMVILGLLIYLPYKIVLAVGLAIVLGHNLLDIREATPGFEPGFFMDLMHSGHLKFYQYAPHHSIVIIYPFLAWTGLMIIGYCSGVMFTSSYTPDQRKKVTLLIGLGLITAFVIIRMINIYGDPFPWSTQETPLKTFISFMKVYKYPPSLMYMCVTIGISFVLLSVLEGTRNRFTTITTVYGRTALFYYAIHFLALHIALTVVFLINGRHSIQEAVDAHSEFLFVMPGEGFSLGVVYVIWIALVVSLYPVCRWYDQYKSRHKEQWWLSYL